MNHPRKTLSLRALSGLYLVLLILGIAALVISGRQEIAQIEQQLNTEARSKAARELHRAINQWSASIIEDTRKLSQWDETRQQLLNPLYYAFWKEQRLHQSILDNHASAALYDHEGRSLDLSPHAPLPDLLSIDKLSPYLLEHENNLFLLVPQTVESWDQEQQNQGFLVTAHPVFPGLLESYNFIHLQPESLVLRQHQHGQRLSIPELNQALMYKLTDPDAPVVMKAFMTDYQRQVIWFAAVLSFLLLFYIYRHISQPLATLVKHLEQHKLSSESLLPPTPSALPNWTKSVPHSAPIAITSSRPMVT